MATNHSDGNAAAGANPLPDGAIETDIPARLDRLPWGRFHTLVIAALGITWILDGLEVTLAGAVTGALKSSPRLHLSDVRVGDNQDTVRVLPFHSSKGLEFPLVIIPGAGKIASSDAANDDEARLLYVAMTRAMDQLIVTGSVDG